MNINFVSFKAIRMVLNFGYQRKNLYFAIYFIDLQSLVLKNRGAFEIMYSSYFFKTYYSYLLYISIMFEEHRIQPEKI